MNSKKQKYIILSLTLLFSGAFLYYFYSFNPAAEPSKFLSCPSKTLFGINCPGCGAQRMIHHLLHLEFKQAFFYNPLLFVALPVIALLLVQTYSNWVLGTKYRFSLFYSNTFVWWVFVILMAYAIFRNTSFYPFI